MATIQRERAEMAGPISATTGQGAWSWILQRISAGLLVFFLLAHFWVLHFAFVGEQITFQRVLARVQSPYFIVLDSVLLAVVLYHGLNGVWQVVVDFGLNRGTQVTVAVVLWVIGLAALVIGINGLLPLLGGQAFMQLGAG